MNTKQTEKHHYSEHEPTGDRAGVSCSLCTTAAAAPEAPQITRQEAREAILLQLRKTREDGGDQIYFGALNIHPDLDDDVTFGQLIDVLFDAPRSLSKTRTIHSTVNQKQERNTHTMQAQPQQQRQSAQPENAPQLTLINGNGRPYKIGLPKLMIQGPINDVALAHIQENTGLAFTRRHYNWLESQPETGEQIAALFMTYNFKTRYYNNADEHNTLFLKSDHHIGYQVDSICFDCVKHNHIPTTTLETSDRLAC